MCVSVFAYLCLLGLRNSCVGRSKLLGRLPVAYLVCNGSPPVAPAPSLMTFREVETLFHGEESGGGINMCVC